MPVSSYRVYRGLWSRTLKVNVPVSGARIVGRPHIGQSSTNWLPVTKAYICAFVDCATAGVAATTPVTSIICRISSTGNPPALPGRLPEFDSSGNIFGKVVAIALHHETREQRAGDGSTAPRLSRSGIVLLPTAWHWQTREDEARHRRPKGHAALSRSTSDKPPALPEVADFP